MTKTELTNLTTKIDELLMDSANNQLAGGGKVFEAIIIGFAAADDPVFEEMRGENIAGSLFRTPLSWLPASKSVLAYFLAFSEEVRRSNYDDGPVSKGWLHGRFKGEALNNELRRFLVDELQLLGFQTVAPLLEDSIVNDYELGFSSWSERHAAYAAGLGTFGLHGNLITRRGTAGRIGSVITTAYMKPSSRLFNSPFSNCPWIREGSCGVCIDRCPAGAINSEGLSKSECLIYLRAEDPLQSERLKHDYPHSTCGKCQTAVPCEDCIPPE